MMPAMSSLGFTQIPYASVKTDDRHKLAFNAIYDRVIQFKEFYGTTDPDKVMAAVKFSFQRELGYGANASTDWLALILKLVEMFLPMLLELLKD